MAQSAPQRRSSPVSIQWTPRLITFVVLLILLLIFILQNSEPVDVTFLFWNFEMGLVWALLGSAIVGALLGWMVPRIWPRRSR